MSYAHSVAVTLTALILSSTPAVAQVQEPIPAFAADVRGAFVRFKEDPGTAAALGVDPTNLPTHGLGIAAGAHWYPGSIGRVKFGLGGEVLVARGSRTPEPASADAEEGPTVDTRLMAFSPQVSLNFGKGDGWSYISGGLGLASFTAERPDAPVGDGGRVQTLNYGGGARWFIRKHLAFSLDLRFYTIGAQDAAASRPAFPRMRLMVFSAGAAFR